MRNYSIKLGSAVIILILFLITPCLLLTEERFFDSINENYSKVVIAVFYPSVGTIKNIEALLKNNLLALENFKIVGIYYYRESYDYSQSKKYIKDNKIDWFAFHEIKGKLSEENLFKKNSCTSDFKKIFKKADALIFFGGADIPPKIYGEKTNLLTQIRTPYRHFVELSCAFHFLGGFQNKDFKPFLEENPDFPILAFCLGVQTLNVATGGTLYQDIWSEIYKSMYVEDVLLLPKYCWHKNPYFSLYPLHKLSRSTMHKIKLLKDGKFCKEMKMKPDDMPIVLSSHHQALKDLGKDMKAIATSIDKKIIEAIEHVKYSNVLGVQFHPENFTLWDYQIKVKFSPEQKESISRRGILENNPPSFEFHKKIWSWFTRKVLENYKKRIGKSE
ncbi:gamma-glutamyl-gamma-aminobutyrate hydrolase family protein [Candidatus Aminicenantes bacterium AH-873-B07]|jgi:putative glutamine amidotransferase|nr:gamma-glutamyl-gamma-aminobutyrate hydrolase family protein [Candidatus Aminicenantes bacterium AH-873-B07]